MSFLLFSFLILCAISDIKDGEFCALAAFAAASVGFVSACQTGHIPVAVFIVILVIGLIIFHWLGGSLHHIGEGDILLILGVLGCFWRHDAVLILTASFFAAFVVDIACHIRHLKRAKEPLPFAPFLAALTAAHILFQWLS